MELIKEELHEALSDTATARAQGSQSGCSLSFCSPSDGGMEAPEGSGRPCPSYVSKSVSIMEREEKWREYRECTSKIYILKLFLLKIHLWSAQSLRYHDQTVEKTESMHCFILYSAFYYLK